MRRLDRATEVAGGAPRRSKWPIGEEAHRMRRQAEMVAEYRMAVRLNANSPAEAELKRLKV